MSSTGKAFLFVDDLKEELKKVKASVGKKRFFNEIQDDTDDSDEEQLVQGKRVKASKENQGLKFVDEEKKGKVSCRLNLNTNYYYDRRPLRAASLTSLRRKNPARASRILPRRSILRTRTPSTSKVLMTPPLRTTELL